MRVSVLFGPLIGVSLLAIAAELGIGIAAAEMRIAVAGPLSISPMTAQYATFGEQLRRGAEMNEVPLVVGVKQSAGDLKLFADLMLMAPDKLIYSAVDALMYPSYVLGAHGSIAAILTAAPHASVELWNVVKSGDHPGPLNCTRSCSRYGMR